MDSKSAPRRRHDAQLKARVLAACKAPGASVSAVALAHGLNANLVRKWLHGRGLKRAAIEAPGLVQAPVVPGSVGVPGTSRPARAAAPTLLAAGASFVPIEMSRPAAPAASGPSTIDIEVSRAAGKLSVRWPLSAAAECTAWLRELAAGMLK